MYITHTALIKTAPIKLYMLDDTNLLYNTVHSVVTIIVRNAYESVIPTG